MSLTLEIRKRTELLEKQILSPFATLAVNSKGRLREEAECEIRTAFQRDRDRIIHSKSFRRLKHKTQVFLSPEGDHYRTRLTHTLEVAQIARTVARALCLNEDLTEAIALGHDLGHTPFGHAGERALREVSPVAFHHNEQSVRVVERLENHHRGLNLTQEVRDGILCHTGPKEADTPEGRIVRFADRIAYINHDIDDAVRAGVLHPDDIPADLVAVLGNGTSARINTMVRSLIENSVDGRIQMDDAVGQAYLQIHKFMFENVYRNPQAKDEEKKVPCLIETLYHYVMQPGNLPEEMQQIAEQEGRERAACDYIAGMTDHFAVALFRRVVVPKSWGI